MENNRITCVVGAGAALDFRLPNEVISPSTCKITKTILESYKDDVAESEFNIVDDICQHMNHKFSDDMPQAKSFVNFELLFHVLEMYCSYGRVWEGNCHNPNIYPVFAPFVNPTKQYNVNEISHIMRQFIVRIVKIVKGYDDYFFNDGGNEEWYRFFSEMFQVSWMYSILIMIRLLSNH